MTVFARGIDYAWQHPDPHAIKAAGYDFVCRYYSRDPSKNLTRAEADALAAAGLWIVGNWEHTASDALGGRAAGIANAQLARSLAAGCGQPASRPVYESDDWDVTPAQEATVTEYLRGWDSVLGVANVGEYAGFYPLRVQRDAGVTSWEWQPRAWSGGQWEPRVNIRQTGTAIVGGVEVDVNEAWTEDYGQWQPGRVPVFAAPAQPAPPRPEDNDMYMSLTQPGEAVVFTNPAAVLGGTSHLLLAADFGDAVARVAVFGAAGWNVLDPAQLPRTGGAWKLAMPGETNKVSVRLESVSAPGTVVGAVVLAG